MPPKTVRAPGRPRGFDEHEILVRAMQQFYRYGYAGTSARQLQQATGLSAPSLYNVFGSKRGLFLSALRHYVDTSVAYMFTDLANGSAGIDDLNAMLDQLWQAIETADVPMGCLVLNTRGEFGTTEPDILAVCDDFTHQQVDSLRSAFVRAAALGEIPKDRIEIYLLAFRMMLNGIQHFVRTNGLTDEVRTAYAALRFAVNEWREKPAIG